MKPFLLSILLSFTVFSAFAKRFYVDPANGSMANNGSFDTPWRTFEEVLSANLIKYYKNSPIPYDAVNNQWVETNPSAPIQAGDTIILRDGKHGSIYIRNYNNKDYITVLAEKNQYPIFSSLKLTAATKWRFQGITISAEPYGSYETGHLVMVESHDWHGPSKLVDIMDCFIFSTASPWTDASDWVNKAGNGIYLRNADSCRLINNTIENVEFGIRMVADYVDCIGNTITNFSGDGIRMSGSYQLVENNTIKNCYKVDDNHDDGIQSFTTGGLVVDNNTIRGNIILNYEDPNQPLLGDMQGIGCFDGLYHNWVVENNLIIVNHWHGISLYGAVNCKFINNTVLDPTPEIAPGPSWIKITDDKDGTPSSGCIIKNNVAGSFDLTGEASNNVALKTLSEYQNNFVDPINNDFKLLSTSVLVGAGDDAVAPGLDIEGIVRPQGSHADIGCYEYVTPSFVAEAESLNLRIYPNPVVDELIILGKIEGLRFSILDLAGHSLAQKINDNTINVSDFPKGLYILKIRTKNDKIYFYKFVK